MITKDTRVRDGVTIALDANSTAKFMDAYCPGITLPAGITKTKLHFCFPTVAAGVAKN